MKSGAAEDVKDVNRYRKLKGLFVLFCHDRTLNKNKNKKKHHVLLQLSCLFFPLAGHCHHQTKRPLDLSSGHSLASRSSILTDSASLELERLAARVILVSVSS